jgi:hypothetical protein
MAVRIIFSLLGIALGAAFVAVGLFMAFWRTEYLQWVRWSNVEHYAPWLVRGWDANHLQYRYGFRIVGISMALFGIATAILSVWIPWFQ